MEKKFPRPGEEKDMNPRYPNFHQEFFVAGDVEQFEGGRDLSNGDDDDVNLESSTNVWMGHMTELRAEDTSAREVLENIHLPLYRMLPADAVDNTFSYLFNKVKKGIYIRIKNRQLVTFLPFSKHHYVNEWSSRIRYDPSRFRDMAHFLQYASERDGVKRTPTTFNYHIEEWYANNGLFRNEYPVTERDRNLKPLHDLFQALATERELPDLEFFLNRRDFPVLSKKGNEPYDHIYDGDNIPLKSHSYQKHAPVLSMVTSDRYADLVMPTHEDWIRVCSLRGQLYEPQLRDYRYTFEHNWDKKRPCAVFRGASTGIGVTPEREANPFTFNARLYTAKLSMEHHLLTPEEKEWRLDAGITEWNTRPRKIRNEPFLRTIEVEALGIPLVKRMSPEEQSTYKYILNLDGHVSAFRLTLELHMGSVVLLQEYTPGMTNYRTWVHRLLQPYRHYVPVKRDLSDLMEQIEWCRTHDDECRQIALNARAIAERFLSRDGILDYLQYLLCRVKTTVGKYRYTTQDVEEELMQAQREWLMESFPSSSSSSSSFLSSSSDRKKLSFPFDWRDMTAREALCRMPTELWVPSTPGRVIYQSTSTAIELHSLGKLTLAVKRLLNPSPERTQQWVNEGFVGLSEVNALCRRFPNFRFTFAWTPDCIMVEYVPGETLDKYLLRCSADDALVVMMQVCLALAVAQEHCGWVHNDLNGWNVVVRVLDQPIVINYPIRDRVIRVTSRVIPVLIDYGRSHIIHEGIHYGQVHPFTFSTIQDLFCVMVCSLSVLLTHRRHDPQFSTAWLTEWVQPFAMTPLCPTPIRDRNHLARFVRQFKKYNEMLYADKTGIEKLHPMNLFDVFLHLRASPPASETTFHVVMYPEKAPPTEFPSAPLSVYRSFWRNTFLQEWTPQRFAKWVLTTYEQCKAAPHLLCFLHACQVLDRQIEGFEGFVRSFHPSQKELLQRCSFSRQWLMEQAAEFFPSVPQGPVMESFPGRQVMNTARFSPRTFAIPSRLLTLLQSQLRAPSLFVVKLHRLVSDTFLIDHSLSLPEDIEHAWVKLHRKLFTVDTLSLLANFAQVATIRWMAGRIYPRELKEWTVAEDHDASRQRQGYQHLLDFRYADELAKAKEDDGKEEDR